MYSFCCVDDDCDDGDDDDDDESNIKGKTLIFEIKLTILHIFYIFVLIQ